MEPVSYLLILIVCLVGAAFSPPARRRCCASRKSDLDEDVKTARGPSVLAARELLQSTQRLLVTVLLGNNIVNITSAPRSPRSWPCATSAIGGPGGRRC
jgi:Mg2+/Co2+ transporter CorB